MRSWADQVPTSSGLWQQGDQWVVWWIDGDGARQTSHPMPYPLAREKLTEWRNRPTGGNRSTRRHRKGRESPARGRMSLRHTDANGWHDLISAESPVFPSKLATSAVR